MDIRYRKLLRILYHTTFYILIANDENRCSDGYELRYEYEDAFGDRGLPEPSMPCSVLEMLIALARRMDFILDREDGLERTAFYFWQFIRNLGLEEFDDSICEQHEWNISDVLTAFIDREYDYSGEGGLFPLEHPDVDQRDIEIWEQMNRYVFENYPD